MTFRNDVRQAIAILADDLTSAGDAAAPFLRAGHDAARILLSTPAAVPQHATGVTAVDLGSRVLDEEAATMRTWRAARLFADSELLLKTVDSTLRGHVAAEVRAALAGSRRRAAIIAPAFPAEGRVTVEGVQYVRGVPVHESDFARDPVHPVQCSDLARVFPEAVLAGPNRAAELPELIGNCDLIVYSAAEDGDLDRLVAAVPRLDDVLWVGSPGLTAAVLTLQTPDERRAPQTAQALARSLAAVVQALTEEQTVDALIVTGGETAATVLQTLGATGIGLLDEPEPGIARGTLLGQLPLPVLIKAGGFGDDAMLLRLCHLIRHPLAPGEHA